MRSPMFTWAAGTAVALLVALTLVACSRPPAGAPDGNGTVQDVGSIDIVPSGPSPAAPVVSEAPVQPVYTPRPTMDEHDIFEEGPTQEDIDAVCEQAAAWWRSAGDVSAAQWMERGEGFIPDSELARLGERGTYEQLVAEAWKDFKVIPYLVPTTSQSACIFTRPSTKGDELEALSLVFISIDPVQPMVLLYQSSDSIGAAYNAIHHVVTR